MSQLFLDMALVNLSVGGKTGAQRMAGKQFHTLIVWQIGPKAGFQHATLDEAGDMFVREAIRFHAAIVPSHTPKNWAVSDLGEV